MFEFFLRHFPRVPARVLGWFRQLRDVVLDNYQAVLPEDAPRSVTGLFKKIDYFGYADQALAFLTRYLPVYALQWLLAVLGNS